MDAILTLNAGSSSLKFGLYRRGQQAPVIKGQIRHLPHAPELSAVRLSDGQLHTEHLDHDLADLGAVQPVIEDLAPDLKITFVAHRVVHGGSVFSGPVKVTTESLAQIAELASLAPLHQPAALHGIELAQTSFPGSAQSASFDTSFHTTQPKLATLYGLPKTYYERGLRRYGFHGLSYDYIAHHLTERLPAAQSRRMIVAHLGSGASLCALKDGKSVASSMGFSALEGLPMGTRPGTLDPGIVLHLIKQEGMSPNEVEDMLYHQAGLKGMSGISADAGALLKSEAPAAREALDYFCHRTALGIGEMVTALGGIDTLVFTAGIGENASAIRMDIVARLSAFGLKMNDSANENHAFDLTADGSQALLLRCPTDEESVLRRDAERILAAE